MNQSSASSSGPLAGLLVVALEQAVAAPYCTMRFADAGARVIKIERDVGDFARAYDKAVYGESTYFVWLNRGKQSLVLNIKREEDKTLLENLLAKADVFIQNLAPGAAERAGFGSEKLRAKYPSLITIDISGYGETGPYQDMKAYDLLVQAESGLTAVTGRAEGPGRVGVSVCDITTGLYAYSAALEALNKRQTTGQGASIKVSLFDSMAEWMSVPYLQTRYGGNAPKRIGLNHPSIAPYGAYSCADGALLLISIQNEREWQNFCDRILGNGTLASDDRFATMVDRVKNRPALDVIVSGSFQRFDRPTMSSRLKEAGIAFGAVNEVEDLIKHPQLRTLPATLPDGHEAQLVAPPAIVDGGQDRLGRVPAIGEHSDAILNEFGGEDQ